MTLKNNLPEGTYIPIPRTPLEIIGDIIWKGLVLLSLFKIIWEIS